MSAAWLGRLCTYVCVQMIVYRCLYTDAFSVLLFDWMSAGFPEFQLICSLIHCVLNVVYKTVLLALLNQQGITILL